MGGMGRPIQTGDSIIISAFHSALFHQLLIVLVIVAVVAVGVNTVRTMQYRRLSAEGGTAFATSSREADPEPAARRILRVGFGLLWLLDSILQLQSSMPFSLPSSVMQPAASSSPSWVQSVVHDGVTVWSNHPVQAAAATVWIQIGLGLWLLVAPRGWWSRFGGLASVSWGLVVWVFGEAFGGIFGHGLTWLFGTPGAALFYCAAGLLVALPERVFATPRLGRVVLAVLGAFFLAMAALQAWPGRGFWQGRTRSPSRFGTLAGMVHQMAQTPQPGLLAGWVAAFGRFDAAHGWGVNLGIVVALAGIGLGLLSGKPSFVRGALIGSVVFCLADWVLIQDLGFFGGVGTDPNSMVPLLLVVVAAYVALVRVPAPVTATTPAPGPVAHVDRQWWRTATLSYLVRGAGAMTAVAIVLVGFAPLTAAATNPNTDPIVTEAYNGTPNVLNFPAPSFRLVDQHGTEVSLASLRGHAVALTFLDPVCTTDCPLIAQMFHDAERRLSFESSKIDFVAVVANPIYRSLTFVRAFDRQEGLVHVRNWLYLTGSEAQLRAVWDAYGDAVVPEPGGSMVAHGDLSFIIDVNGRERDALDSDPGPDVTSAMSSVTLLSDRISQVLHS